MNNWHGILKIKEIQHLDVDGTILWSDKNIKNLLHNDGEKFILNILYTGSPVPSLYYFGLDNRNVISVIDNMSVIQAANEPTTNGYSRQSVASSGDFTVALNNNSHYEADGPAITFRAAGGSWGPVANLFLTNASNYTGLLISSISLSQTLTLASGQSVSMKFGMALQENS